MQEEKGGEGYGLKIGRKTFMGTLFLLLGIMMLAGVLTRVIPQGFYEYAQIEGRSMIVPGSYKAAPGAPPLAIWRWFTAPVEVLFTNKALTAMMIMLFILLIGGAFLILEKSGILSYMMYSIIRRFQNRKYLLLSMVVLLCMLLGSTMGLFEEAITLVPITVALALMLGWDSLMGVGMSILSVGFGFAAGTFNPFTVGITQRLADLPAFSGFGFRIIFFILIYGVLLWFLLCYAKKIEINPQKSMVYTQDTALRKRYQVGLAAPQEKDPAKQNGTKIFVTAIALVFSYIVLALFIPVLSDYSMLVMALCFTVGAFWAGRRAGLTKGIAKTFFKGMASIAPSVLLILLAMSVTHIMEKGNIIDTILHFFYTKIEGLGAFGGVIALFLLVLVLEFFISGSSAKAFLLIPIIVPLSDMIGVTRQTAVQSFILGDGFANMLYPTNVVLLITLGLVGIPYARWFKWTWKLQLVLVILSILSLLVAVLIGYGPY